MSEQSAVPWVISCIQGCAEDSSVSPVWFFSAVKHRKLSFLQDNTPEKSLFGMEKPVPRLRDTEDPFQRQVFISMVLCCIIRCVEVCISSSRQSWFPHEGLAKLGEWHLAEIYWPFHYHHWCALLVGSVFLWIKCTCMLQYMFVFSMMFSRWQKITFGSKYTRSPSKSPLQEKAT